MGTCRSGAYAQVAAFDTHFGEEPLISGVHGAGNIFLSHCNLRCVFCQNYQISQQSKASTSLLDASGLARIMLDLQRRRCHCVGFVSPTHFVPQIVEALEPAVRSGFRLPLVYNSGGYDSVEVLRQLEGIFDIYLPDLKYSSDDNARRYSGVDGYVSAARRAISEMHRQAGATLMVEDGALKRGLIIRLLVMPNGVAGVEDSLRWILDSLGTDVAVSVMSQYYPANAANRYPEINRTVTKAEYDRVLDMLHRLGFSNGWVQEFGSYAHYRPDFQDPEGPFRKT